MGGHVERSARAELDLIEQSAFLAESSDAVAARFIRAVEATCEHLASSPGMGKPIEPTSLFDAALRWWPVRGFPNHLIFYRELHAGVLLVRVLHGARDWPELLAEL